MTDGKPIHDLPATQVVVAEEWEGKELEHDRARCVVPDSGGIDYTDRSSREALWDRYYTAAPRRRTPSERQYSDRQQSQGYERLWPPALGSSLGGAPGKDTDQS